MKMIAATLLLLSLGAPLSFAQDDLEKKVAAIVARLADDSIDAREQAVKDLADLGTGAIPLLKKAIAKAGDETRGRLEEAIRTIELRDALARSLPPLQKITLDLKKRPAREAIEEIASRAGIGVKFEGDLGKGTITLALKDVTPIEALDAVCRADGQLTYQIDTGDEALEAVKPGVPVLPRLSFTAAPFVDCPATYVRHYRIRAVELSLIRTNSFKGTKSRGNVQLELFWLPGTHPDQVTRFEVEEIKDDQGRILPLEKKEEGDPLAGAHLTLDGLDPAAGQYAFDFKYPEADAKKVASMKGSFTVTYPKETKTLVFEKPAEKRGKSLELHGLKITLEEYQNRGTEHTVKIVVGGKYAGPKDPAKEEADPDSLLEHLPFSPGEIEFITESGLPLQQGSSTSGTVNENYVFTVTLHAEKTETLKEIRIPCVLTHHLDGVKFELKDMVFPK
jgi:hypothetical protein